MAFREFKKELIEQLIEQLRYEYEDDFEWEERSANNELPGTRFLYLIANEEDEYLIATYNPLSNKYTPCEEGIDELVKDYSAIEDFIKYDCEDAFKGDSPTLGL